jgi:O-antigen/teichoic acid export membrane protein
MGQRNEALTKSIMHAGTLSPLETAPTVAIGAVDEIRSASSDVEKAPAPAGSISRARARRREFGKNRADSDTGSAVLSVIDQAVVSATTFLTAVIIGRICSKDALGIYSLAFSILLLVRGVHYQLVSVPYTFYWRQRPAPNRACYLGSTAVHQVILTVLAMVALTAYALSLRWGTGPTELSPVTWVLMAGLPFLLLREFVRSVSLAHLNLRAVLAIDVTVAVLQVALLLSLAWLQLLSVSAAYAAMGLSCSVACVGIAFRRREPIEFRSSQFWQDWKYNWSFGKWALANHLIGASLPSIVVWIVALALGNAEAGVLAAATTLVGLTNPFVMGLSSFLGPRAALAFSEGSVRGLVNVLVKFGLIFVAVLGTFCPLVAVWGDSLAALVYGGKYSGLGMLSALLAAGVLVNSIRMTAGIGLWSLQRPQASALADFCACVVAVVALFLLLPTSGVLAAAIGILCGAITGLTIACTLLVRSLESVRKERSSGTRATAISAP